MNFKTNETALLGIMAAVVIVVGFLFYFFSTIVPVPGAKFVLLAPFLSFVFVLILNRVTKIGTILIFSVILGGLLSFITLFMGAAILITGLLTEGTGYLLRGLKNKKRIIYTSAFFPVNSLLTFSLFLQFLLGRQFFTQDQIFLIIPVFIIVYILGIAGGKLAYLFLKRFRGR